MLSFFPLDVLDEIWDLIESVSEGFLTYSFSGPANQSRKKAVLFNYCKAVRLVNHLESW